MQTCTDWYWSQYSLMFQGLEDIDLKDHIVTMLKLWLIIIAFKCTVALPCTTHM